MSVDRSQIRGKPDGLRNDAFQENVATWTDSRRALPAKHMIEVRANCELEIRAAILDLRKTGLNMVNASPDVL